MLGLTSVQNFVAMRKHFGTAGRPSLTPGTTNTSESVETHRLWLLSPQNTAVANEPLFLHDYMLSALIFCKQDFIFSHTSRGTFWKSFRKMTYILYFRFCNFMSCYTETSVLYSNHISLGAFTITGKCKNKKVCRLGKEEWRKLEGVRLRGTHFRRSFSDYQEKLLHKL